MTQPGDNEKLYTGFDERLRAAGLHDIADEMAGLIRRERMCNEYCGDARRKGVTMRELERLLGPGDE
jgi:hypothetical protein